MAHKEIFVGRKVWIKPAKLYSEQYKKDYIETTITKVGLSVFQVEDAVRPKCNKYHIGTLEEVTPSLNKNKILLDMQDGGFDRLEQRIIKIRKHFNSRAVYGETEEDLDKIINLLQL